ncbi:MAG: bifunctional phosphoribosyl-AMP cyclohydrolase/phosphoribosyl-ATP diphosphatase HisIE [Bacteroidales bacterium]|nr:bifunctional phosphoribosyl-AMP cyclohydrolase/phosphoribosyl-ATP diphosphatase HisIE [Bacteroidales bacterium]
MKFSEFNLEKCADGLLPVIVQDADTLKVLMLAYMDEEAYERTVETGLVTFHSRSRNETWTKGETSGNFLHLVEMFPDCDKDTLLIKARPKGPTCHRGTIACFDTRDEEGFLGTLAACIRQRHEEMPEDHYTTYLFNKGVNKIAQKVGEEAVETVIEAVDGNKERFLYEAGDLVYHLMVLFEQMGFTMADLEKELVVRHK